MPDHEEEIYSFEQARKRWNKKVSFSKDGRKARTKRLSKTVDQRSLRAKGRSVQFNARVRPDLKAAVHEAAKASGLSLVEWVEAAFEAALDKGKEKTRNA